MSLQKHFSFVTHLSYNSTVLFAQNNDIWCCILTDRPLFFSRHSPGKYLPQSVVFRRTITFCITFRLFPEAPDSLMTCGLDPKTMVELGTRGRLHSSLSKGEGGYIIVVVPQCLCAVQSTPAVLGSWNRLLYTGSCVEISDAHLSIVCGPHRWSKLWNILGLSFHSYGDFIWESLSALIFSEPAKYFAFNSICQFCASTHTACANWPSSQTDSKKFPLIAWLVADPAGPHTGSFQIGETCSPTKTWGIHFYLVFYCMHPYRSTISCWQSFYPPLQLLSDTRWHHYRYIPLYTTSYKLVKRYKCVTGQDLKGFIKYLIDNICLSISKLLAYQWVFPVLHFLQICS